MTAERILRAAAVHLAKHGWIKSALSSPYGHCLMGAIGVAAGCSPWQAKGSARRAVLTLVEVVGEMIPNFNDYHCKSARDAIAALEIAADLAAPEWKP